ncbi:hypothetical protein GA0115249_115622 [Streptomyces sp. PpalLS-921]|nr:hypothetical protein GA0115249_115622 [Streptomyces sp. PpalLS-921]
MPVPLPVAPCPRPLFLPRPVPVPVARPAVSALGVLRHGVLRGVLFGSPACSQAWSQACPPAWRACLVAGGPERSWGLADLRVWRTGGAARTRRTRRTRGRTTVRCG